jgi:hypothetical protein
MCACTFSFFFQFAGMSERDEQSHGLNDLCGPAFNFSTPFFARFRSHLAKMKRQRDPRRLKRVRSIPTNRLIASRPLHQPGIRFCLATFSMHFSCQSVNASKHGARRIAVPP